MLTRFAVRTGQDESVRHKLKGRGATGGANEQQLDVGRLAEMIKSAVERSINGRLNTPKSTVTERLEFGFCGQSPFGDRPYYPLGM